jgi:WD40 repeat protein
MCVCVCVYVSACIDFFFSSSYTHSHPNTLSLILTHSLTQCIFNASTGETVFKIDAAAKKSVRCVRFSPSGKYLAVVGQDDSCTVNIFDRYGVVCWVVWVVLCNRYLCIHRTCTHHTVAPLASASPLRRLMHSLTRCMTSHGETMPPL